MKKNILEAKKAYEQTYSPYSKFGVGAAIELTNGKLGTIQVKGDNVRVTCPSHKDGQESHPSCGIYAGDSDDIEYGTFHCFTCNSGGPLYHFVAECFDESDEFGKDWENYQERIKENFNIFDFELSNEDMNSINSLNEGYDASVTGVPENTTYLDFN